MAILDVVVPQLSESVAEATLLQWHKKVGEAIARDENLIDIETDKVVLELPAPAQGVLIEIVRGDGSSVVAGELIARIDTEATASASAASAAPTAATAAAPAAKAAEASAPASTAASSIAMPAAAKMLAENNMSANAVAGTGKDGRVTKGDVIGALESKASGASSVASSAAPAVRTVNALPAVAVPTNLDLVNRPEQRVPMSRLRARIAERLLQSQATNAILTTFNEVNMQPVMDLRNKYKDKFEKEHGVGRPPAAVKGER
jgi:2-oxoglutarate dehydrogenase E2 component (dihydrolipoamide succinyltransferase)